MVCLEHGVRCVQLLDVCIVGIDVIGEWLLVGLLTMAHVAMLVVQTALEKKTTQKQMPNNWRDKFDEGLPVYFGLYFLYFFFFLSSTSPVFANLQFATHPS